VNIETASIAIASSRFQECDCDPFDNPDYSCECGRSIKNVVSMRCGDGDGLYAVMTLRDHTNVKTQNKIARTTRSIGYVIDCDSQHESGYLEEANMDRAGLLDGLSISQSLVDKELHLYDFGTVRNTDGIFISDKRAHVNSSYAIISSQDELLGKYYIFAICTEEAKYPIGYYPKGAKQQNEKRVIVPRLIIVAHQNYAAEFLEISEKLPISHEELSDSWMTSIVNMHLEHASNTAIWNNANLKQDIEGFGNRAGKSKCSWVAQGMRFYTEEFLEWWEHIYTDLSSLAARTVVSNDDAKSYLNYLVAELDTTRAMFDESEKIYSELINKYKGTRSGASFVNDLCFSLFFPQNKLQEAETLLLDLLNWQEPSDQKIIAHGNLGIIEYRRNNYSKAKEFFNLSLSADPTDSEALYYLGCISFHENDLVRANSFWNKCSLRTGMYDELAIMKLAGDQAVAIPQFTELARVVDFKDDK
ncbi:MAG: hypothetical protein WCR08_14360, partial [Gammaproteobacteria bacterium]